MCKGEVLPQLSYLCCGIKNAGLGYSGVVAEVLWPMEDKADWEACENLEFVDRLFRKLNY